MIVHAIPKIRFTCRFSIIVSHYYDVRRTFGILQFELIYIFY